MDNLGMSVQAVRTPILDTSKNKFTTNNFLDFIKNSLHGMKFEQDTIVCITESLLARAQNNYVTIDDIAEETHDIFKTLIKDVDELLNGEVYRMDFQQIIAYIQSNEDDGKRKFIDKLEEEVKKI